MSISVSATDPLTRALSLRGLSSAKADFVEKDLDASVDAVSTSGTAPDRAAVRSALNERMKADVAAGTLTQADADAVNKTLDDMDAAAAGTAAAASDQSTATGAQGGAAPAGGGGGGGGGGGATEKTELYRTEVDAGAIATITITYTDGSTATETKASAGAKAAASAKTPQAEAYESGSAGGAVPGTLFDLAA
jgi:hypothetical protein